LAALKSLQQLNVDLSNCEGLSLSNVTELGSSLVELKDLKQLSVDLQVCEGLPPMMHQNFTNRAMFLSVFEAAGQG